MKSRANPQIWRIAEWLFNSFNDYRGYPFKQVWSETRNYYYDKAKELNYMFLYNTFASKDDLHND